MEPDFRLTGEPLGNTIQLQSFGGCDSVETDSPIEHHPGRTGDKMLTLRGEHFYFIANCYFSRFSRFGSTLIHSCTTQTRAAKTLLAGRWIAERTSAAAENGLGVEARPSSGEARFPPLPGTASAGHALGLKLIIDGVVATARQRQSDGHLEAGCARIVVGDRSDVWGGPTHSATACWATASPTGSACG
jgi:hypothetical protein